MSTEFNEWLDIFIEEKDIDLERNFEVEGPLYGTNFIPVGAVVESMKIAPKHEQDKIQKILVMIDFKNGDVYHFLKHLAGAMAR